MQNEQGKPNPIMAARLSTSQVALIHERLQQDVIDEGYSIEGVLARYYTLSKFLIGSKTEVNPIIATYLLAGFEYILTIEKRAKLYRANADSDTTYKARLENVAAFKSLLAKWGEIVPLKYQVPPHDAPTNPPVFQEALTSWNVIQLGELDGNPDSEFAYTNLTLKWFQVGGGAPTYQEAVDSALPKRMR